MSNIASVKTAETSAAETISGKNVSIRVSPNGYFSAIFLATFFAAFLIYLEYDWSAAIVFAAAWIFLPYFLWTDKIVFDGKRLTRTGVLPRLWATANNSRIRLRVSEIEQVETQALRALKRGGNVFYRYRTSVQGKGLHFAFASGGEEYRDIINRLFNALPENVMDNRSLELRDYLAEPKETLTKARFAKIPSDDVLEDSLKIIEKSGIRKLKEISEAEEEKADYLRRLANELRLAGYFLQSLEAFRRALLLKPRDGWLLFEFARCLYSFAGSERNARYQRRAVAALRLAEKRANGDGELLARLGESFFQYGDQRRAQKVFQKSQEAKEENFRAFRGMAEIALREGKIAYVIHHFSAAFRFADTNALRRWTNGETEYFSRLNSDEEYMDLEISRIKFLETLENTKKSTLRIAFFGFPAILFGVVLSEDLVSNIGWAISSIALIVWGGVSLSRKVFAERIPFELLAEED